MCRSRPPHFSVGTIFEISRYLYRRKSLLIRLQKTLRQHTTGFALLEAHQITRNSHTNLVLTRDPLGTQLNLSFMMFPCNLRYFILPWLEPQVMVVHPKKINMSCNVSLLTQKSHHAKQTEKESVRHFHISALDLAIAERVLDTGHKIDLENVEVLR
ncbi:hypothetical protein CSKR_110848 [Clonorchis sinensis]|uniref:Uncharacterized protein n=1 Tax=Clonorchis sinensis TaxID=79923 RepID=A0A3R7F7Y9_CLOSI|nr:hypothetical protein CSKR_110848 [Clonorchis sinensis]